MTAWFGIEFARITVRTACVAVIATISLAAAGAASFTVTTTADTIALDPATSPKDASGEVSLRSAIMAANAQAGADTVELQAGATYTLSLGPSDSGLGDANAASGDLDITDTLTINGHGALVDAAGIDRVFAIENASLTDFTVLMYDLTVTGGAPKGFLTPGGGISVRAATLVMKNCSVSGNTAAEPGSLDNGGGIAANGVLFPAPVQATLELAGCTVAKNKANNGGGIVAGNCSLVLDATSVSENEAVGMDPGTGGGGLFLTGSDTVAQIEGGSAISGNLGAADGGGISIFSAALTLIDSTVAGNRANGDGGGIYNSTVSPGKVTLSRATLNGNTADADSSGTGDGGALFTAGPASLSNVTVSGNEARAGGGLAGIGPIALESITVTANKAAKGGGILVQGDTTARNTILAGNSAASGPDALGTLISNGYNLLGDTSGASITGVTTGNLLGVDPLLGPLSDNGGPTHTHALLPGSPAIDAGAPADAPATDQRGTARPQDGNADGLAVTDIGAYEFVRPYSLSEAARALRIAGGLLSATPGDLSRLDSVADGVINLSDAALLARKSTGLVPNP